MQRFKIRNAALAILLAFAAVLTSFGAAFADSTDPILSTYQDPSYAPYHTEVLNNQDGTVLFLISPSTDLDTPATFFTNSADAEAVARTVNYILDDPVSLSAPIEIITEVEDIYGNGSWLVFVTVTLPTAPDVSVGSLSVQAVNARAPAPDNVANFTIIRNPSEPLSDVTSVDVWIANPVNSADVISPDRSLTVSYNDYPGETVYRDFPHALDATYTASLDPGVYGRAVDFVYDEIPDSGVYVVSMTIDRTYYGPGASSGWQYRVYRQYDSSKPDSTVDELTEYVGIDAIELLNGDIVYWAYGSFGNPNLFPPSVTPRFPVPPVASEWLTD